MASYGFRNIKLPHGSYSVPGPGPVSSGFNSNRFMSSIGSLASLIPTFFDDSSSSNYMSALYYSGEQKARSQIQRRRAESAKGAQIATQILTTILSAFL